MSKEHPEEWRLQIKCPYCNAVVAESIDGDVLSEMYEDEDEATNAVLDANLDTFGSSCDHTAFYGEANMGDVKIAAKYKNEMIKLATAISKLTDKYNDIAKKINKTAACSIIRDQLTSYVFKENISEFCIIQALENQFGKDNFSVYSKIHGGDEHITPIFEFIFIKT